MKVFFIVIFGLLLLVGAGLFMQMEHEQQTGVAVDAYMNSRGKIAPPSGLRRSIGQGI